MTGPAAAAVDALIASRSKFSLSDVLCRFNSFLSLDPIVDLSPYPVGPLLHCDADWTLESWLFLPLLPPAAVQAQYGGRSLVSGATLHTLAASETLDGLLTVELPAGRFGVWLSCLPDSAARPLSADGQQGSGLLSSPAFVPFAPEGQVVTVPVASDLEQPCWHFVSVAASVAREDSSDANSRVSSVLRLFIDGKLAGRLEVGGLISDVETIGNTRDGKQAFGKFASVTVLPVALSQAQVHARYKEKRQAAEKRLRMSRESRIIVSGE